MLNCLSPENSRSGTHRRFGAPWRRLIGLSLFLLQSIGCRMTSDVGYADPSYAEQNQAVLDIVSYRMTREQAVEALEHEGVQGSYGVSDSVYYCDVWDRGDGRHWRLDVALFFDQSGRLYKVGPSQPDISAMQTVAGDDQNSPAKHSAGDTQPTAGRTTTTRLPASRTGRRTPFADPDGLR